VTEGSKGWKLANFCGMQIAWFACVLGAAQDWLGIGWLIGLAFVVGHFVLVKNRRPDVIVAAAALGMGLVWETLNRGSGVATVARDYFPAPIAPSWLLLLWVAFALAIRHSMGWMAGRYFVGGVLGAVAGPLSWRGGAKLGGATFGELSVGTTSVPWWVVLGVEWAIAMPFLLYVAARAGRNVAIVTSPRGA
jgi:hypothetical protein